MEFNFNLNHYIPTEVVTKINSSLLPERFAGDRRSALQCTAIVHEILDVMGSASAKTQGLVKPVTSGEKLRNSDHTVYLLTEENQGRKTVIGFLKIGPKNLYVYDESGHIHEKKATCVLDFYVHESKQHMGYGKMLYDYMLQDMAIVPSQLAIDHPPKKFLSFLNKHYGLEKIIPQTNNFVLFEGFFATSDKETQLKSPERDGNYLSYDTESNQNYNNTHSLFSNDYESSEFGRHAAFKAVSTMGQILDSSNHQSLQTPGKSGE